jgi:hypothetical protein
MFAAYGEIDFTIGCKHFNYHFLVMKKAKVPELTVSSKGICRRTGLHGLVS